MTEHETVNAPAPASLAILCKGKRQVAFRDSATGLYHCGCCGVQVPVCW